jgi:hypothetical protein
MKFATWMCAALSALTLSTAASAQTAAGNSGTTCNQSGVTLTCVTTTTITLPAGTNLTGMTLPQTSAAGPACTSLSATPALLDSGVSTSVSLSVVGCPTSGSYKYVWGAPVVGTNAPTASYTALLNPSNTTANLSVEVCFANNPTACNTYSATIAVKAPVPTLAGCQVTPATTTIEQGTTASLSVNCAAGTGAGSGISYQWLRNGSAIAGAVSPSYTLSAINDTAAAGVNNYTVQLSNAAPSNVTTSAASVTITLPTPRTVDYCPTTPVRYVIAASETFKKIYTTDYVGTYGAGDDFIVQIDVSASDSTVGRFVASVGFTDYGANRGGRFVTLSKSKCDYNDPPAAYWLSGNFFGVKTPANSAAGSIALGQDTRGADARLTPGTWYLNMRNAPGSCPSGQSCHAVIQWSN